MNDETINKPIKQLVQDMGTLLGEQPKIKWPKPITTGVAKVNVRSRGGLLAEIEIPMHYAEVHWIVISVYGKVVEYPEGRKVENMTCEVDGEPADEFLPESLMETIANEILLGDHD